MPPFIGGLSGLVVDMEDLLDWLSEQAGDGDRQRQGRAVPLGLDRVDGLPRHAETGRQLPLRERGLGPQLAHIVPHKWKVSFTQLAVKLALQSVSGPAHGDVNIG